MSKHNESSRFPKLSLGYNFLIGIIVVGGGLLAFKDQLFSWWYNEVEISKMEISTINSYYEAIGYEDGAIYNYIIDNQTTINAPRLKYFLSEFMGEFDYYDIPSAILIDTISKSSIKQYPCFSVFLRSLDSKDKLLLNDVAIEIIDGTNKIVKKGEELMASSITKYEEHIIRFDPDNQNKSSLNLNIVVDENYEWHKFSIYPHKDFYLEHYDFNIRGIYLCRFVFKTNCDTSYSDKFLLAF